MNKILGRKQRIKNEDWIEALGKIEELVTKAELDKQVKKTVSEIKQKTKGKKAAFAWSGGKDSLVLEKVSQMAGIQSCVLVICNLEYQAFTEWVEAHKPPIGNYQYWTGHEMARTPSANAFPAGE